MTYIDDIVGVQVQIMFEPELFKLEEPTNLVVKLVPVGDYQEHHYTGLLMARPDIKVAFALNGFNNTPASPESGNRLLQADFTFYGYKEEQKIPVVAGHRVGGTDYREFVYLNGGLVKFLDGHIVPSNGRYYLRRPGDSGNHLTIPLFKSDNSLIIPIKSEVHK